MNTFLPEAIDTWLKAPDPHGKGQRHQARLKRMKEYADICDSNFDELEKAWGKLARSARDEDALISIFLVWPDEPTIEPFPYIYGKRLRPLTKKDKKTAWKSPDDERQEYLALDKKIAEVKKGMRTIGNILADVPPGHEALEDWHTANYTATFFGLSALQGLLKAADPFQKYLTKQPNAKDAAIKNYTQQLAQLNRYLSEPKPSAIATIAKINCPGHSVSNKAIGAAWSHYKPAET